MKFVNDLLTKGLAAGLNTLAQNIFSGLIKSKTFRSTVIETEKAVLKGIRYAADPKRETNAFHKREMDEVEYLARKARESATGPAQQAPKPSSSPPPPPGMTAHGYQPESEWTRWYKTKRYEIGMFKQRWFKK